MSLVYAEAPADKLFEKLLLLLNLYLIINVIAN